jgi:hypothetical protein
VLGFSFPWRLSGLLSGYLPTDTRPQARAKLGKSGNKCFDPVAQVFFPRNQRFLANTREVLPRERAKRSRDEQTLKLLNRS